jgi:hypothetical protein
MAVQQLRYSAGAATLARVAYALAWTTGQLS